jgi:tetratricopeptide (TPR) repeat protein
MSQALDPETDFAQATAGDIAVINLESGRRQSWSQFWQAPHRPGIAEYIVEQEHLTVQFLGDLGGLGRLGMLANQLESMDPGSVRTSLIRAQVASMTHRFDEARRHLAQARLCGAPPATINRLSLGIDQACGAGLDAVLVIRRQIAAETRYLEDLVPLGALLADLKQFDEADKVYRDALQSYRDVSPFPLAWACFQLGVLWGELVDERQSARAAQWYRRALAYLPSYVKARVHLAEIYLDCSQYSDAEALLIPVICSSDPEVSWRLGDVSAALGREADAAMHIEAARRGFETLLDKHLLAFADHGAAFYASSGNDPKRAFELASINAANRPTPRAIELPPATAIGAGEPQTLSTDLAVGGET